MVSLCCQMPASLPGIPKAASRRHREQQDGLTDSMEKHDRQY